MSTEFISSISAPTFSTSFDFRSLVKGSFSDVYHDMSKHSSDHNVLFCYDPLLHLAIDASSFMKLKNTRTDSPRFDATLSIKGTNA